MSELPHPERELRFAFIHVMKTAGTTLVSHLEQEFGVDAIYPNRKLDRRFPGDVDSYMNIERLLAIPEDRMATLRVFTGHYPYMAYSQLGVRLATFTLLRNPVDRTISLLKQFKRHERYQMLSIEEIYEREDIYSYFIHNHQTKVFSLVPSDQARAILKPVVIDDERFARAKANLESIDVVGVTERFDEFMRTLQRRFGWWADGINLTKRTNVSPDSTSIEPALRRRIAADNPYDLALYEHAEQRATRVAHEV